MILITWFSSSGILSSLAAPPRLLPTFPQIFSQFKTSSHLFHFPPDPEEVESCELLEVKKSPVSGAIEGGEEVGVLGHVLQALGHPVREQGY